MRVGRSGRRRRWVDDAVAAVIGLVLVATVGPATWVAYRSWGAIGRQLLHPFDLTLAPALWTGLVAGDLFVVQVVLLARLPWLERSWGRGRLVRWHRWAAYASVVLTALHVVLFTFQRARSRPGAVSAALGDLFVHAPHMLLATIGTGLIALVTVSSVAVVRLRLRYETWHLLHLWSYVGLALTLPHEFAAVDFTTGWVRAFWWAVYAGGAGLVVLFRVLVPVVRSLRHRLRVVDRAEEAAGAVSLTVGGRRVERLDVRSGEFLLWRFGGPGRTRAHPYSLSAAPGPTLRVTVGGTGDGARAVGAVATGARVWIEGPYGDLGPPRRRHPHLLLMCAGVGVTPYRALLEDLPLTPGEATLIQRASSPEDLLFADELERLAAERGFAYVPLPGHRRTPWSCLPEGLDGPAEEVLARLCPQVADSDVLLCGPPAWAASARRVVVAAGARPRAVHEEAFGW